MIHTQEKPFKCTFPSCDYSCTSSSDVKRHSLIHSNDKPFKCDYPECKKSYTTGGSLRIHKMNHTGEKPFKCLNCNYETTKASSLNVHLKSCHSRIMRMNKEGNENVIFPSSRVFDDERMLRGEGGEEELLLLK